MFFYPVSGFHFGFRGGWELRVKIFCPGCKCQFQNVFFCLIAAQLFTHIPSLSGRDTHGGGGNLPHELRLGGGVTVQIMVGRKTLVVGQIQEFSRRPRSRENNPICRILCRFIAILIILPLKLGHFFLKLFVAPRIQPYSYLALYNLFIPWKALEANRTFSK